jgi:hypothetical protein
LLYAGVVEAGFFSAVQRGEMDGDSLLVRHCLGCRKYASSLAMCKVLRFHFK